ncbi:MAG: hypothetical protein LC798_20780 [Chloroflexi bacterium]|nr:hypothetical protein [Chloroflexota bacterium]
MTALLLDERPLVIQPSLVRRVGIAEAAILQQLHYWSQRSTSIHDGERWVYKTYADWADEIGVTAKVVRAALDKLRRLEIVVAIQSPVDPRDNTRWWRIDHAVLYDDPDPDPTPPEEGRPSAPQGRPPAPQGRPPAPQGSSYARVPDVVHRLQTESKEARAPKSPSQPPVSYGGKRVPKATANLAAELLEEFNRVARRDLGALDGQGRASGALKQIVGALIARPDVDRDRWLKAVRNTVASPPSFVKDRPLQLGDIFGERAAEHALANTGQRSAVDEPPSMEQMLEAQKRYGQGPRP